MSAAGDTNRLSRGTGSDAQIAATVHPLRLAYARTLQAVLAVEIVRFDVDAELGGDARWLDEITEHLTSAETAIRRLAVAERINLGEQDEDVGG